MTDDWNQISEIFSAAAEISSSDERERYLKDACGENQMLRARVESLLAAHSRAEGFLDAPAPGLHNLSTRIAADRSFDVTPGSTIGSYRVIKQIGEGGIGVVFLAEQSQPVQRNVALKVIKLGMDTHQVIKRFEAEKQALALMDHPNIAKVYDAGSTMLGRPYFVMELVAGVAINEYCDGNQLTLRQRLELFVQVCQAVHHAHQKGLIHRDIKPSNIVVSTVDDHPVAKVIDFGIAKATGRRKREKTLFTESNQLIGTIEYMSPEQAEGSLDIDTRADVYSLGVVLYELLTGKTPFEGRELRSQAYGEMQRIIREVEPTQPSTRLTTLDAETPASRGIELRKLSSMVRGELDWIVMKCLEKDRARRYESASSLATDIVRHLADEPISAAAPSRLYRARKFVRRHRAPVIASSAVVIALIAGIVGTTIGMVGQSRQRVIAEKQRREAKEQAAIAEAVQNFQSDMLSSADPRKLLGDKVTVLQAVSAAVKELDDGKLKDQPLVEASVRDTIGNTLRDLGRHDLAEPNLRRAVELRRANLPAGSRSIAQSMENLAVLLQWLQKFPESEQMHREAITIFAALNPPDEQNVATALNNLGWLERGQGNYAEAEKLSRNALAIYRKILPPDHPYIGIGLNNIANSILMQEKPAEAEPVAREALDFVRKTLPAGHPDIGATLTTMAITLQRQGKFEESEKYSREARDLFKAALPADHPNVVLTAHSLAMVLGQLGRDAEAEPLLRESIEIRRKIAPANDPSLLEYQRSLAMTLTNEKKFDEAELVFAEAISVQENTAGLEIPLADMRMAHGVNLMGLNRFPQAESEFLEAHKILHARPNAPQSNRLQSIDALIWLYSQWDKAEPNRGYDRKAADWKRASQPATTSATKS